MLGALRTPGDTRWYRLCLGVLVLAAWAALAVWGASPFAGLLTHRTIGTAPIGTGPLLPAAGFALSPAVRFALFLAGWTLMTIAMMLPASLPLVNLFRRVVDGRPDRTGLVLGLTAGYVAVWAAFGALAYAGDAGVHALAARLPGGAADGVAAAILLVAGLYQFTSLKQMCLEKCRSPYLFLVTHWGGRHAGVDAVRLGVRHGAFCVGCCWTLMLLMFAIGGANLGWMLALGAVMAAERATPWGRHLTRPLGAALAVWAVLNLAGIAPFPTS